MNLTHWFRIISISAITSSSILGCSHSSSPSIPLPKPSQQPTPTWTMIPGHSHSRSLSGHYTWVRTEVRDPRTQQLISTLYASDETLTPHSEETDEEQTRIRALGMQYRSITLDFQSETLTLNSLNQNPSLYRIQHDESQINRLHIETLEHQSHPLTPDETEHEATTLTFFIRDHQLLIQRSPLSRRILNTLQTDVSEPIYALLTYVFDFENNE